METDHNRCLICESNELVRMQGYETNHLGRCRRCGFVFARKVPTAEQLMAYYSKFDLSAVYVSSLTNKRYDTLLDRFEPFRKNNRFLDVGCGTGALLKRALDRGWEVYGVEFTEGHIDACRQSGVTNIHIGGIDSAPYDAGYFDVVTSIEVIEHINTPHAFMRSNARVMRGGGLFYCTTPNFNGLLRFFHKGEYDLIYYPGHLCYYTPRTLVDLMNRCGLRKYRLETAGISLSSLRNIRRTKKQQHAAKGSDDQRLRESVESKRVLRAAKWAANKSLSLFGLGESIKGSFTKP